MDSRLTREFGEGWASSGVQASFHFEIRHSEQLLRQVDPSPMDSRTAKMACEYGAGGTPARSALSNTMNLKSVVWVIKVEQ